MRKAWALATRTVTAMPCGLRVPRFRTGGTIDLLDHTPMSIRPDRGTAVGSVAFTIARRTKAKDGPVTDELMGVPWVTVIWTIPSVV